MDPVTELLTERGRDALEAALQERDPDALSAVSRLRDAFGGDLGAAALTQVALRRSGRAKLGDLADVLMLTRDGLEQATRPAVSRWRAQRLRELGAREVWDLGCGIGVDARALAESGLDVVAVEQDPTTAALAAHNLDGRARVVTADATALTLPDQAAVYLDPARRDERGRTWDPSRLSPSFDVVLAFLASGRLVCAKLGPGLSHSLIPEGVLAEMVSHCAAGGGSDVVECSLWAGPGVEPGVAARLIAPGRIHRILRDPSVGTVPIAPQPRGFVAEPDGAAIRARVVDQLALEVAAERLSRDVAYLTAESPVASPWLTWFEVLEVLPYEEKALRSWVRAAGIGTLEIKKRGIDVDPAGLRRRLRPKGKAAATLVLTPTARGARALACRRVT